MRLVYARDNGSDLQYSIRFDTSLQIFRKPLDINYFLTANKKENLPKNTMYLVIILAVKRKL